MMMMMNCFCGMVDRRKAFSLISSRGHCQRSSPSRISDSPRAEFEPAQNPSSGFVEWSCVAVIATTPRRHNIDNKINFYGTLEEPILISVMQSWFKYLNRNFNLKNSDSVLKSLFLNNGIGISVSNPNFSNEIAVSVIESRFQFSSPNFSNEIAVSIFESEFQFPNPIVSVEIAVSASESHCQYYNLAFNIRNQDFIFVTRFSQFKILAWSTFIFVWSIILFFKEQVSHAQYICFLFYRAAVVFWFTVKIKVRRKD